MAARKPVEWIASSRSDIRQFPPEVRRVMGQAINDAQLGLESPVAKALKSFDRPWRAGDRRRFRRRYVSHRLHSQVCRRHLRPARVPEEVEEGDRHTEA